MDVKEDVQMHESRTKMHMLVVLVRTRVAKMKLNMIFKSGYIDFCTCAKIIGRYCLNITQDNKNALKSLLDSSRSNNTHKID